jgi:hypothetical protein
MQEPGGGRQANGARRMLRQRSRPRRGTVMSVFVASRLEIPIVPESRADFGRTVSPEWGLVLIDLACVTVIDSSRLRALLTRTNTVASVCAFRSLRLA